MLLEGGLVLEGRIFILPCSNFNFGDLISGISFLSASFSWVLSFSCEFSCTSVVIFLLFFLVFIFFCVSFVLSCLFSGLLHTFQVCSWSGFSCCNVFFWYLVFVLFL